MPPSWSSATSTCTSDAPPMSPTPPPSSPSRCTVPLQVQRGWLLCYHSTMSVIFVSMLVRLTCFESWQMDERSHLWTPPKAFEMIGSQMTSTHLLMYLDLLHPIFGYTQDALFDVVLALFPKSFLLLVLNNEPRLQAMPVVHYVFVLYCLEESVRFLHALAKRTAISVLVDLLQWLKYTLWMLLFPLIFLCEGVLLVAAIPLYETSKKLCLQMPNKLNLAFDMPSALRVAVLGLMFPVLYTRMSRLYAKRCRKLGVVRAKRAARFALF